MLCVSDLVWLGLCRVLWVLRVQTAAWTVQTTDTTATAHTSTTAASSLFTREENIGGPQRQSVLVDTNQEDSEISTPMTLLLGLGLFDSFQSFRTL